jgi:hypothetical protein
MKRANSILSEPTSASSVAGAHSTMRRAARFLSGLGLTALLMTGTMACAVEAGEAPESPDAPLVDGDDNPDTADEPADCHHEVSSENFAQAMAARDAYLDESLASSSTPPPPPMVTQPVVFHVLHKHDGTGKVPQEALVEQVEQLNAAFSASEAKAKGYAKAKDANIRFTFRSANYVENDDYHNLCALKSWQDKIKKELAVDPAHNLNVYVCYVVALGLAWLPYQAYKSPWTHQIWDPLPEDHYFLGVLVHHELLPGSTVGNGKWSQGDLLVHEVGHHYGLMHPYEGDCYGTEELSDGIADTPRQKGNPQKSCPAMKGTDSCPGKPGKDDNANYMGINFDSCRSHFTPGQVDFMRATIAKYKPALLE